MDTQTQKMAQSNYTPLTSPGMATFTLNINQAALISGDTFTLNLLPLCLVQPSMVRELERAVGR